MTHAHLGEPEPRNTDTSPDPGPDTSPGTGEPARGVVDFEALYRSDPDPWEVGSSWYERRKTALTLAMLRRERYDVVWDPACGTGHLALGLAPRARRLILSDLAPAACELTTATLREAGVPTEGDHVSVHVSRLPAVPPPLQGTQADLVILSEVLYYLDEDERAATWAALDSVCHRGTDIVAVHWTPQPEGALLAGAEAQRELNAHLGEQRYWRLVTHTDMEFVAALWSRHAPPRIGR